VGCSDGLAVGCRDGISVSDAVGRNEKVDEGRIEAETLGNDE